MDWSTDLVQWFTNVIWSFTGFWGELIGGAASAGESDGDFDQWTANDRVIDPWTSAAGVLVGQGDAEAFWSVNSPSAFSDAGLSAGAQLIAPTGLLNPADASPTNIDFPFSSGSPDTSGWLAWGGPTVAGGDQNTAADFSPSSPFAAGAGAGNSQSGTRIVEDTWQLGAQSPLDSGDVFGDGRTYYHYGQVTLDGVDYDAYKSENSDVLRWNQVLLVPAPASPTPSAAGAPDVSVADFTFAAMGSQETVGRPSSSDTLNLANTGNSDIPRYQTASQNSLANTVTQILRGSFADSVLQRQLSSQGLTQGSFVSPVAPHDYLFNPNATSLTEAMLLAAHSPNTELLEAGSAEGMVSALPIVGSVATWMNPHSGPLSKGFAVVGGALAALPLAAELGGLASGVAGSGGELADELGGLGDGIDGSVPPPGGGAPPPPPATPGGRAYQALMSMRLQQAAINLEELGYTNEEIRSWHFFEATDSSNPESISAQLDALRASDPEAAQAIIDEISNNEVVLHHGVEEGVMELVYKSEHTSPQLRDLFHPGGRGGMSRWGSRYGGP